MLHSEEFMEGEIEVYLNKYFSPDFFSWKIPQNGEYGLITALHPKDYYSYFIRKMNFPRGSFHASLIPVGTVRSYSNRTLLVGDACGMTKPLTGGGIIFSLMAAKHAASAAEQALDAGRYDSSFLSSYEKNWKKDFGSEILLQILFRKMYRKMTNREIDKMLWDFGPSIEKINFCAADYDKLSSLWVKMPKIKMLKTILSKIPAML
jgi:flavin-dependent dehydrogenase